MSETSPRIHPLPTTEWTEDAKTALRVAFGPTADALLSTDADAPRMPNVLATLMRHPKLTGPFMAYNTVLLNTPTLEPRHREIMILRVAWRASAPYEWLQHVRVAASCDISPKEVEAIAQVGDTEWTELEADLLAATDQMLDRYRIDDHTWKRLAERLDERQLMEVPFVVGTYTALAMVFNSFDIQLDPELFAIDAPKLRERA